MSIADNRTKFLIGTRKSNLALEQTRIVCQALGERFQEYQFEPVTRDTVGDLDKTIPFSQFNSKNLWTEELEELLHAGSIDFVVHSLKDVPTFIREDCALADMMPRVDPRDVFVAKKGSPYKRLSDLPPGSVVGTSSVRRTAQLARHYPQLKTLDARGNVETRLAKLDAPDGPFAGLIIAAAGLLRLNYGDRITQYLDAGTGMYHAVGQGALGIEIRANDDKTRDMINAIGDKKTTYACFAERSLLKKLEGGCSAPIGVETEWINAGDGGAAAGKEEKLEMRAIVCSVNGKSSVALKKASAVSSPEEADKFGVEVADELCANGAADILQEIQQNKPSA